jgi:hypothetical protein
MDNNECSATFSKPLRITGQDAADAEVLELNHRIEVTKGMNPAVAA